MLNFIYEKFNVLDHFWIAFFEACFFVAWENRNGLWRKQHMDVPKIFDSEYRFCEILWENEPVSSSELVKLCREKLEWKKSTTYTVIRRLSERGVLKSENAIVTSLIS